QCTTPASFAVRSSSCDGASLGFCKRLTCQSVVPHRRIRGPNPDYSPEVDAAVRVHKEEAEPLDDTTMVAVKMV
ncbi:hypothetical protein JXA88_01985, partial [Candidatus Fermentibacteria bacterium]|nr:hypothetical protein [Candidatus Fermentibacteria bacterium]